MTMRNTASQNSGRKSKTKIIGKFFIIWISYFEKMGGSTFRLNIV